MKKTSERSAGEVLKIIGIPHIVLGLLLLVVSIGYMYNDTTLDEKYEIITAEVVDITYDSDPNYTTTKHTYVSYEYDGVYYEHISFGGKAASMRIGSKADVYIDPDNPGKPHFRMGMKSNLLVGILGIFFGGIGIGLLICSRRSNADKKRGG